MRTNDLAGLAVVTIAAAVAAGLGAHGLRHPGPILAAAGGGSLGAVTAASSGGAAPAAGTGATGGGGTGNGSGATGGGAGASANSGGGAGGGAAATLKATSTRLSQTPYAPYAVPLYPTRSAQASQALSGFTVQIAASGPLTDKLQVFIAGTSTPALSQVIARTDKVYFVEGSMGDDGPGIDTNGGDDGLVVTNAAGYIMQ